MKSILRGLCLAIGAALFSTVVAAQQAPRDADWASLQKETLAHFQALVRFDTQDPPGREQEAADYLQKVLTSEGIPVEVFTLDKGRPNIVARLKGTGRKRPLLMMGHTDTVNIDPAKWTHPPFGAVVADGYVYGRGTLDDKDNVVASLMTMLTLKRLNVPLDRDVIFLAESGEEGSTRVGIQFMVNEHFAAIDAEYCLAETGTVTREGGQVRFASVQTAEKLPRAIELVATGPAGHGSVPLTTNAIARLSNAAGHDRRLAPAREVERDERHVLQAPRRDLAAGAGEAVPRRLQLRSPRCRRPRSSTCASTSPDTPRCSSRRSPRT